MHRGIVARTSLAPVTAMAGSPAFAVQVCAAGKGVRDDEVFEDGSRKAFGR